MATIGSTNANWRVRDAVPEDVPDILRMIKDLAVNEKEPESRVKVTEKEILKDGFGENSWFECLVAEELYEEGHSLPKKKAVGTAIFHNIFSPWDGRALFLQHIYIDPASRGRGIGTALFKRVSADLAVYEEEPESRVKVTEKEILKDGFEENPWFECLVAEELYEESQSLPNKKTVGYTVFYNIYSPWDGRALFLRHLFVEPASRGKGIGTALFKRVSAIAVERKCARMDWTAVHGNKLGSDFYYNHGAVCLDELRLFRLTGERLLECAGKKPET